MRSALQKVNRWSSATVHFFRRPYDLHGQIVVTARSSLERPRGRARRFFYPSHHYPLSDAAASL